MIGMKKFDSIHIGNSCRKWRPCHRHPKETGGEQDEGRWKERRNCRSLETGSACITERACNTKKTREPCNIEEVALAKLSLSLVELPPREPCFCAS
ncbi:hypothetical protein V1477_011547 [Vespula maculifrons]